jgi:hypothetical protein
MNARNSKRGENYGFVYSSHHMRGTWGRVARPDYVTPPKKRRVARGDSTRRRANTAPVVRGRRPSTDRIRFGIGSRKTANATPFKRIRIEWASQRDDSLIGGIIGAINGGEVRGRAVWIPRDSVVTFRLKWDRGLTQDSLAARTCAAS